MKASAPGDGRPPLIDLDANASTPLHPDVVEAMLPWLSHANPSSVHAQGRAARSALDGARDAVAEVLGCEPAEVIFTASGSEANALALRGAALGKKPLARVAVSRIEHPSVLESTRALERAGVAVGWLAPDAEGSVPIAAVVEELEENHPGLLALMWVNNETGVVQPIPDVARKCREAGALLLCDGVQGIGKLPLGLPRSVDLFTFSGHKLQGPRGIGVLVARRGVDLQALVPGHQERGRRAGTENVAAAVGLATALKLSLAGLSSSAAAIARLRDDFEAALLERFPEARVHGQTAPRVPNTTHVAFPGCDGEAILIGLDLAGICASLGAACSSGSLAPSHVLLAMGVSPAEARASLRFSLGPQTTRDELDRTLQVLEELVPRARLA